MCDVDYKKGLVSFISLFILSLLFLLLPKTTYALTLFEDNFDSGINDKWIVRRNTCINDDWEFSNGKYGINIFHFGGCVTETTPSDQYWQDNWNNYIIELDMEFVSGTDKNIAWRYENSSDWVDIHFIGQNIVLQRLVELESDNVQPFINGNTYHFKIIANGNLHEIYYYNVNDPENVSYIKAHNPSNLFLTGRPALQASAGADPSSEVWFDNFIVKSIPKGLDVPHFSQRDPQWSSVEYDNASVWQPNASWRQIEDIGCALTSGAMVLNYNGYTHSTETDLLNPETLNTYLKERDGFNEVGGVNWVTMSRFPVFANTQDYYSDKNLPLLELSFKDFSLDTLKSELEQKLPVILKLRKDDNTHFVVAKAVEDENIYINDPLDLTDTDALLQERYADRTVEYMLTFTPSFTDLSYIWMNIYDPDVKVLVEHNGLKLGKDAEGNEYREIPDGNIFLEHPIAVAPELEEAGTGTYKLLMIPKPESGNYSITFHSENTSESSFDILGYDIDADNSVSKHQLSLTPGGIQQFSLNFDKQNSENNVIQEEISFELVRANLEALYTSGEISHHSTSNQLNALLNNAERIYPKNKKPAFNHLNQMLDIIDKKTPKTISHQANQLLSHLLQLLILHLQTS